MTTPLLRINIPVADTSRTVKITGNETVIDIVKQVAKRLPNIENVNDYGLYLPPKLSDSSSNLSITAPGLWLDDNKTIQSFSLTDKV